MVGGECFKEIKVIRVVKVFWKTVLFHCKTVGSGADVELRIAVGEA